MTSSHDDVKHAIQQLGYEVTTCVVLLVILLAIAGQVAAMRILIVCGLLFIGGLAVIARGALWAVDKRIRVMKELTEEMTTCAYVEAVFAMSDLPPEFRER